VSAGGVPLNYSIQLDFVDSSVEIRRKFLNVEVQVPLTGTIFQTPNIPINDDGSNCYL
jgi:hypothetical protein